MALGSSATIHKHPKLAAPVAIIAIALNKYAIFFKIVSSLIKIYMLKILDI